MTMAKDLKARDDESKTHTEVDLSESSVYGHNEDEPAVGSADDVATDATIDRLEEITGGADEPALYEGRLGRRVEAFDASSEEEVDALKVNLMQEDDRPNSRDGSGRIVDDVAEEQLAEFTEVGPDLDDEGVLQVSVGNDDTSAVLRRHHPNLDVARADAVVEGNVEDDRYVDEGTAG